MRKFAALLIIAAACLLGQAKHARASGSVSDAVQGRAKFTAKKYDEAIELFRRYLRRKPADYNVWNQLGAAYYHTGQPRRALRYLKHVERRTTEKSYNYYYQGLCYQATESPDKAKQFYTYSAQKFVDEYASRSTFELAAIEYNAKNKARASYWLTLYLQRYRTGVYAAQAQRMMQSLQTGKWLDGPVDGAKKPDLEQALYKYSKLSLSPYPHYWFVQGGWQYADHSGFEPAAEGELKASNYQDMAGIANAGVGIGPWHDGDMTAFAGYTYRQLWNTDSDRIQEYMDDPTDIEYFPLRGDLLERHHQFYADFRRDMAGFLYYGVFARYEFARIGSSLFPSPESDELKKVLKISDTQLLIPWIGASYLGNMRTLAYLYMRKEINSDSPEQSNKTYDFGASGGQPVVSLGLSHQMDFPDQNLEVDVELFRYEFIYNDYWLDYKRQGILLSAEQEFLPRWFVSGVVGYYSDEYVLPRLKQRPCGGQPSTSPDSSGGQASAVPTACLRTDTGLLYQAGVYWNWTQFQRFAAQIQYVENRNPQQKEFQESKQTIEISYTMAFPSVQRVARYVDRFADTAFTKTPE